MNIAKAAETFAYYIILALEQSGIIISAEMRIELNNAVEAFKAFETKK